MRSTALLALLAALVLPACAEAWSPLATLDRPVPPSCPTTGGISAECFAFSKPRVAVDRSGRAAVAWYRYQGFGVRVAVSDRRGRFGTTQRLGRGLRPEVAFTADGDVLVAWPTVDRRLAFARRSAGARRFGRTRTLVAPVGRKGEVDRPLLVPQPGGSTIVVYERSYRDNAGRFTQGLFWLRILRSGARTASRRFPADGTLRTNGLSAMSNGDFAICCDYIARSAEEPSTPVVAVWRARARRLTTTPVPIQGRYESVESVAVGPRDVAVGTVDVRNSGDTGTLGAPQIRVARAGGTFDSAVRADVRRATRSFGPVVGMDDGGRAVLAFQEKARPESFSRVAPVYAARLAVGGTSLAAPARIDARPSQDVLASRGETGTVFLWLGPQRLGLALFREGRMRSLPSPPGRASSYGDDYDLGRDVAASGDFVAATWVSPDGDVEASVQRVAGGT